MMRTFIQFKDGVAFAYVNTPNETEGIEVFTDNPDQFLKKTFDGTNWADAELIRFAEVDEEGNIIEVRRTYFSSDVAGRPVITPEVKTNWKWVDGAWVEPAPVVEETPAPE